MIYDNIKSLTFSAIGNTAEYILEWADVTTVNGFINIKIGRKRIMDHSNLK